MKNKDLLQVSFIIWMLVALFVGYSSYNKDEIIKEKNKEIIRQSDEIKQLKEIPLNFPIGFIQISDTTLFVVTGLPERFLHIERIENKKNFYSYAIRENVRIELYIWKY